MYSILCIMQYFLCGLLLRPKWVKFEVWSWPWSSGISLSRPPEKYLYLFHKGSVICFGQLPFSCTIGRSILGASTEWLQHTLIPPSQRLGYCWGVAATIAIVSISTSLQVSGITFCSDGENTKEQYRQTLYRHTYVRKHSTYVCTYLRTQVIYYGNSMSEY